MQYHKNLLALCTLSLSLAACSNLNSVFSQPSEYNQCLQLRRNAVFVANDPSKSEANTPQWQIQDRRVAIERQYLKMDCDRIIREQKVNQAAEDATQTKKNAPVTIST